MGYDMRQSGAKIRRCRKKKGYTQEKTALLLNIDRNYYSRIESGKRGCSVDMLVHLSELFDVSLDELVFGEDRHGTMTVRDKTQLKDAITTLVEFLESFKASL